MIKMKYEFAIGDTIQVCTDDGSHTDSFHGMHCYILGCCYKINLKLLIEGNYSVLFVDGNVTIHNSKEINVHLMIMKFHNLPYEAFKIKHRH